jgi:hypothetical protein
MRLPQHCDGSAAGIQAAHTATVVALLLAGCAVDDHGLVRVRHYEAPAGHVVRLEAWGAHLVTSAADRGLTLGRSWKEYYFPAPGARAQEPIDPARLPAAFAAAETRPVLSDIPLKDLGAPFGVLSRSAGLSLEASARRRGVTLGLRTYSAVVIPLDFEGIVWIHSDGSWEANPSVHIEESP